MQRKKNSNCLPLISKKAVPSLPFLSSSLNAEVLLPKDCVEDSVHRYHVYSYPFSLLHHSPQGLEKSDSCFHFPLHESGHVT